MNAIGWSLFWMSVPITFMASAALVVERIASRRGPGAGWWVSAASLFVIVALTPLAIWGVPQRFSWRIPSSTGLAEWVSGAQGVPGRVSSRFSPSSFASARAADLPRGPGGPAGSRAWWRGFLDGAATEMSSIRTADSWLPSAWGFLVLSGAGWCLASLLLGIWGVRDCRRRSMAIGDPDLLAEVESLRVSLAITRRVEVRELSSSDGSTAAAAGWLRPFVLFPRDWRSWSPLERRAVLAHELAHIARADYAAGIVAQLGLALHFYHPLIRWMVGRLRLQQELAADDLGAPLAGGRGCYVLALSRMALRPEEKKPLAWPARTFLASGGHLIRRIEMLREKLQGHDRSLSAAVRVVVVIFLIAIGTAAVAFRGISPARAAEPPEATGAATKSIAGQFDLSYMAPDVVGVWAMRPAAISRIPGLKSHFDKLNADIAKLDPNGLLKIESIEQAVVEFRVTPRDRSKKQVGRLITGDWMVRSVEDLDWKAPITMLVKKFGPKPGELVEVRLDEHVYYKAVGSGLGPDACFYFPDGRTVVCSSREEQLRERIRRGAGKQLEFLRGADWRQVERSLVAVAIDNRQDRWALGVSDEDAEDVLIAPLLQKASRWVAGIDISDVLKLRAIATCPSVPQSESVALLVQKLVDEAKAVPAAGAVPAGAPEKDRESDALVRTAEQLLQACRVHREGVVVELSSERRIERDALGAFLLELVP
jgi:BlaR1 peptidase M56